MRIPRLLALSAITVLALTGCTAGSEGDDQGGGQSLTEACTIANERFATVQTELGTSLAGIQSGDFEAAASAMATLSDGIDAALDDISHTQVHSVLERIGVEVDELGSALDDLSTAGTDQDDLSEIATRMNESATELQTAGTELDQLCA